MPQEAGRLLKNQAEQKPLEDHHQRRRIRGAFTSAAVEHFNERCLKKHESGVPNLLATICRGKA